MRDLVLINTAATAFMTGLIWLVQLVHYPSFRFVDKAQFHEFHAFHSSRITMVVLPVMAIELVTSWALVATNSGSRFYWVNAIGVILIWASTFFLSVPFHNRLSRAHSLRDINLLIATNWPRTLLWTLLFGLKCVWPFSP